MKVIKAFLHMNIGALLCFFIFLGGFPHASAMPHMAMHEHASVSGPDCRTCCSNSAVAISATKLGEQKEDDDAERQLPATFTGQKIPFDDVSHKTPSEFTDARILRPPDIIVLNCTYRI